MAELIAQNATAVAVTDELSTLLDWTSIEGLTGFTLIVDNAGGGSGDPLTDIQIDTSVDGGTTVLTDQHAGVPAVPIAAAAAARGTFTETAGYIRVRATCATDEDTTARLVLFATATGRLATLADVRDRLGLAAGNTAYDDLLHRILSGLTAIFESHCHRPLLAPAAAVTEYYAGRGPYLRLQRYPLIAITSITEALDFVWASGTALVADTDYRILNGGANGILYRMNSHWLDQVDATRIIYRGGYCSAGATPGTGETALPADLREAAIEQASFLYKRRDDIGLSGQSFEGGSISHFSALKLLPLVEAILDKYRLPPSL